MKNISAILAAACLVATTSKTLAGDHWLKSGWIYADSQKDMDLAVGFANQKDTGALDQMDRENKISLSSDIEYPVDLIETPFLSGLVSFHFKGSSATYWTYIEAISDKKSVVAATPVPTSTPDVGGVDGAHQEIINGQTDTALPN